MCKNPDSVVSEKYFLGSSLLAMHSSIKDVLKNDFSVVFQDAINYYLAIIMCMPGNVYWLDKNCRTIGCNQNVLDMFGLKSLDDFLGLSFEDMAIIGQWSKDQALSFKRDTLEVLATGKAKFNVEEPPIPGADGSMVYFLTTRVPLFDAAGEVIGIVGISTDITQRKKTELELITLKQEAEAASRAKTQFLANMSHDMLSPLSGILLAAEAMSENKELPQEAIEMSRMISSAGKQLKRFFTSCLDLSKLEMEEWASTTSVFSLRKLIQDIYDLYLPRAKGTGLDLSVDCDLAVPDAVQGHRDSLYRALLNLTGNALKFTQKGSVTLRVLCGDVIDEGHITILFEVEDTGMGIPEDKFKIIFEKLQRLTPAYSSDIEGSGIGLYIVDQFIKRMGGSIHVDSELGKGSRFTVSVPMSIVRGASVDESEA